jgi:aspartyl-tRNA(Asn)/glutamyl-tRNA(Gln) amidotransferase subunit A
MTKRVEDAALILQIIAGKDIFDATTSLKKVPHYLDKVKKRKNLKGIIIGVPKEYFIPGLQKGVRDTVKRAIKVLEGLGARIKSVSLLDPKYSVAVYTILQRSEVSSNLARYDGIRFGNPRDYFGEEAKRRIMLGTYTLSAGYYEAFYQKAQKVRTLIIRDFQRVFQEVDLIVGPTSPSTALPLGASQESPMFGELQDILVEASSIAGLPGLNVVCGFSQGLPVGMQIVGPQFSEDLILQVGYLYEQSTQWYKNKPKIKK